MSRISVGEQSVLSQPGNQRPTAWLGGDTLHFQSNADSSGQFDFFSLALTGGGKPVAYLEAPWTETDLQVSPDRTLATFVSAETGQPEVWIRDFPAGQGKWKVSRNGGRAPRWSPSGNELHYRRIGSTGGTTRTAPVESLFRVRIDRCFRSPDTV